jgi:SAM-dependent methyltransferase
MTELPIVDHHADALFRGLLRQVLPDSYEWENRYVEHEMARIPHVFRPSLCPIAGRRVLEFGCNVAATSIVLSHLGARVTASDINKEYLALATLNARRYGKLADIRFVRVQEGAPLPFADAAFDVVTCNSVFEYVRAEHLTGVQHELDRVLRPGGAVVVFGTSNRLSPIEAHSRRWLINYVPRAFDRALGRSFARGVWPWQIRRGFGPYVDVLGEAGTQEYMRAKNAARSSAAARTALRLIAHVACAVRISPGFFTPFMFAILRKRTADETDTRPITRAGASTRA